MEVEEKGRREREVGVEVEEKGRRKGRWEWRGREGGRKRKVGVEGKVKRGIVENFLFWTTFGVF